MLHLLPPEIALHAISYLPLHALYSVNLVSRDWNALITINEETVYRNAAVFHHLIYEDRVGAEPADSTVANWKVYCRRQLEIEKGWRGKARPNVQELTATGTSVHRIKVDNKLGLIITTCLTGGLSVCDIKSNRVLWGLPSVHVVNYAHCEYERGYIIFNRYDNCKEVWRRAVDAEGDQPSETSPPDKEMLEASAIAAANFPSPEDHWGHFKAWALLRFPEITRAFRFSYPTLLAAAVNNAYLWDIPRVQLVSVIQDLQRPHHGKLLGSINYVEVNDLYVFICGDRTFRIFAREGGTLLYQLSTTELSNTTWAVKQSPKVPQDVSSLIVRPLLLSQNTYSGFSFHGEFMACHVSASGKDLVVLANNGKVVMLPGFQRLFAESNAVHHRDIAITLDFLSPSVEAGIISKYLAIGERNEKLAVATQTGIYVISPNFNFNSLAPDYPPETPVSVCQLSGKFEDRRMLSFLSCLQITRDAIYFTYLPTSANSVQDESHPPHTPVFNLLDDTEDESLDDWEDEESEEEDVMDGNHALVIINDLFLATDKNTVYSVSF